jgi:hypothetical protein
VRPVEPGRSEVASDLHGATLPMPGFGAGTIAGARAASTRASRAALQSIIDVHAPVVCSVGDRGC